MTDTEVLNEIDKIGKAFKTAETKAYRKFKKAENKAFNFYDAEHDVERAARHNAIKRAEAVFESELNAARVRMIDRLENLRSKAGRWAELVPLVR